MTCWLDFWEFPKHVQLVLVRYGVVIFEKSVKDPAKMFDAIKEARTAAGRDAFLYFKLDIQHPYFPME